MNTVISMVVSATILAAPLIIAALGGLFSERSGVVNIALEGIMQIGAFAAAASLVLMQEANVPGALWISILIAIVCGIVFSILLGVSAIHLRADQTIAGTAMNVLAGGLTVYLSEILFGAKSTRSFVFALNRVSIPFLKDIPIIGPMFFNALYPTTYIAFVLVVVTWYVVFKTPFGLRLRSCGEFPQASASMGINVVKMRWIAVLVSGALGGLAGAALVLSTNTYYYAGTVHGLGFVAIATLIFGKWNPWGVLMSGMFFGFSQILGQYSTSIPFLSGIPGEFFSLFPYVVTILAIVFFSNKQVGPKASGQIYDAGKR